MKWNTVTDEYCEVSPYHWTSRFLYDYLHYIVLSQNQTSTRVENFDPSPKLMLFQKYELSDWNIFSIWSMFSPHQCTGIQIWLFREMSSEHHLMKFDRLWVPYALYQISCFPVQRCLRIRFLGDFSQYLGITAILINKQNHFNKLSLPKPKRSIWNMVPIDSIVLS